jgi:hypothetical protein
MTYFYRKWIEKPWQNPTVDLGVINHKFKYSVTELHGCRYAPQQEINLAIGRTEEKRKRGRG